MQTNKTVEAFIDKHPRWKAPLTRFREILQATELEETIKWGMPVYSLHGKNVAGMGAFKSYVGIWFYQGVFLSDPENVLINAQEGKTKAMRQLRFQDARSINYQLVEQYVKESIQNQKEEKEIKSDRNKPLALPEILQTRLENDPQFKDRFEQLSLSKQRDYCTYIEEAKRPETKLKRMQKIEPMIFEGIGLNDRYQR